MEGVDAAVILDLVPDHARAGLLHLLAVTVAAGLAGGFAIRGLGLVAGIELVGGAGSRRLSERCTEREKRLKPRPASCASAQAVSTEVSSD